MASETQIFVNRLSAQESAGIRSRLMEKLSMNLGALGDYFVQNKPNLLEGQINAKLVFAKLYGNLDGWRPRRNKANLFRIEYCVMRIAKRNLKKQTQFAVGQNDVKSILIMVYGDFDGPMQRENKANSKPISKAMTVFCAYYTRDCHGPSGLAMTFCGGFLKSLSGAFSGLLVAGIGLLAFFG